MNLHQSDASASTVRFPASVPIRALAIKGRVLPQHLIVTAAFALSLFLLALLGASSPAQALVGGQDFKSGEVVVKLNSASGATIQDIDADYGLTTLDKLPGNTGIYLLQAPAGSDTEAVVSRLANDTRLLYSEPNFIVKTAENDETQGDGEHKAWGISDANGSSEQYAATALGLPCALALSLGQNSTVAVIDTGAQLDHPALEDNFEGVARYDFVDNDRNPTERPVGLDEDGNGLKDEMVGHGTHVAGIVQQVAPEAKIMPLRVLDTEGYGDDFTIAKAIIFAKSNGADVINLSLGSSHRSAMLQGVIRDAINNGVLVAAAAGNSNSAVPHYPAAGNGTAASADGLVAVTSVDMYAKKSDYANYGTWVDIAAPGDGIRSTFPTSVYANWSGTSMATPFVSGQAALIHSLYALDPVSAEKKIRGSAQPLTLQNLSYVGMLGAGEANACASLK